ncbi:putative NB-ARC domain-containing protein [Seiridium cardinale]
MGAVDPNKQGIQDGELVDIVAVHGLSEDSAEAWTDPETGLNWLRDLLPRHIAVARVLTYGYDASPATFLGNGASLNIQRGAECLVQELYADRNFAGTRKRPIIFICHGLGGILVKKSLVYSSTRTAAKIDHLWDQFVSTFAILFFGSPQTRTSKSNWLALDKLLSSGRQSRLLTFDRFPRSSGDDDVAFQSTSAEFAPIMKQFHIFFFWEELRTTFGDRSDYIVDPSAAVLELDNTEKAGIHATHTGMTKFSSTKSSSYRTVIEALSRYCLQAPQIISHRWAQAIPALNQLRAGEAYELGGLAFDVHSQNPFQHEDIRPHATTNRHFYPPQDTTPDFIGRKDMFQFLQDAFFPYGRLNSSSKRKSFVVFGMGGSGKTQFASKFAEDMREHYTSIFTIYAASPETTKESFCKIAKLGGLEATENAGRHFLSQLTGPWLLVIDNVDDPSLKLQDLYPPGDTPHVLITTRNPDFRKEGTLGSLELKGLQEDEALYLLLTKADIPKPWDASTMTTAGLIAKTLGYLALALIHAGNCIYRRICGLGDYLNLHSASRSILQRRKSLDSPQDEESHMIKAVYSTFDVSLDFLLKKKSTKSRDAAELLKMVSFYHFERIPVEIFSRAVINRQKVTERPAEHSLQSRILAEVATRLEPPRMLPTFLKESGEQLDSYDGRNQTFSMHPLVHAWARDSLSVSERKVWASIAFNTLMESIVLPPEGNAEADGDFHRDIIPHLDLCLQEHGDPITYSLHGWSRWKLHITKIIQPTWVLIVRDQVVRSAKCGYVLASRGQFESAAMHLNSVKDTLVYLLGMRHEKSMAAMLGLAGVLWGLGRLEEAISLQRLVMEARSQLYGDHHEKTLEAMDQLGRSYWLHGQYKEALELQQLAIKRARVAMGSTHPLTLSALDNLGVTLSSWQRWEESMHTHREVLSARKTILGEKHLDTLATMSNLAMALLDLGDLDEAREIMSTVHQRRQEQLGKEHPWTLWALLYLAKIYVKSDLLQEAEQLLIWGIGAGERSLHKGHLGVLVGRGELARVYAKQNRRKEALVLLLETIKLLQANRGIEHPDCVYAMWKLARLYRSEGHIAQAIETCQIAIERAKTRLTREHPISQKVEALLDELRDLPDRKKPVGDLRGSDISGVLRKSTTF